MRMVRGQAFETMMLVISVIVALAILAVLMGILGGFRFGVGDPKSAMQDQLSQIQQRGYGSVAAQQVTFEVGDVFLKEAIKNTPILTDDVCIICDKTLCTTTTPIKASGTCSTTKGFVSVTNPQTSTATKLTVTSKVEASIVTCGDASVPRYCIALARNAATAATICSTACKLT
ncbi:MAG: hypothetical protein AABW54_02000 [Candidatus Micrarchaeota archaeon]